MVKEQPNRANADRTTDGKDIGNVLARDAKTKNEHGNARDV